MVDNKNQYTIGLETSEIFEPNWETQDWGFETDWAFAAVAEEQGLLDVAEALSQQGLEKFSRVQKNKSLRQR